MATIILFINNIPLFVCVHDEKCSDVFGSSMFLVVNVSFDLIEVKIFLRGNSINSSMY